MALIARYYLEEERRLSLKVFGNSVNFVPVLWGEGELVAPLEQGGEGVAQFQDLPQTVQHLPVVVCIGDERNRVFLA